MNNKALVCVAAAFAAFAASADMPAEIAVTLKLDEITYVSGERIRGIIEVQNNSPDTLSVGYPDSPDSLFVEVFRTADGQQLDKTRNRPQTARFKLKSNKKRKFEVFLGDTYGLTGAGRFIARPVMVHRKTRFEGAYSSFDVVPGMKITGAVQIFSNREGLSREFELLHWSRKGNEHLFISASDRGVSSRKWVTTDIGPMMRLKKPTISILSSGEVVVIHRNGPDSFVRSLFWSLPDALEFRSREMLLDPETAGQRRIQEMMDSDGGVKPVDRPWWKFW